MKPTQHQELQRQLRKHLKSQLELDKVLSLTTPFPNKKQVFEDSLQSNISSLNGPMDHSRKELFDEFLDRYKVPINRGSFEYLEAGREFIKSLIEFDKVCLLRIDGNTIGERELVEKLFPPEADFWATLAVAEGQDRVLLLAFLHTAGRRGELYQLRWEDVDFANSKVRLKTRKRLSGSLESDWLLMTEELHRTFAEHQEAASNEWVFVQRKGQHKGKPYTENRKFPQRLCIKAGIKPFECHGIRGLAASILAKHNVPMISISQLLRHRNL